MVDILNYKMYAFSYTNASFLLQLQPKYLKNVEINMKKSLLFVSVFVASMLGVFNLSSAATFTENGVTYTDEMVNDRVIKTATILSAYSQSTSWGGTLTGHVGEYDYAQDGSSSGWVNTKGFYGNKTITIDLSTFSQTGSATFKIQGRIGTSGNPIDIYSYVLTAVGSNLIPIIEKTDYIRCGVNLNAVGTESITVKLECVDK